jgi:hypothetical protein
MDPVTQLPLLLGLAWLAPLVSFVAILFFGPRMGPHGRNAAWVATAAIATSLLLSLVAFGVWVGNHPVTAAHHGGSHGAAADHAAEAHGVAAVARGPGHRGVQIGHHLRIGHFGHHLRHQLAYVGVA